jgi:hypothetical protein
MDDVLKRVARAHSIKPKRKNNNKITIVYTGSVLLGVHNPSPLFQAVAELIRKKRITEDTISIIFVGSHDGIDKKIIHRLRLTRVVKLLPPVSRLNALRMQENATALLFLGAQENGGAAVSGTVSGKIFEYFTAGTEILAVGTTNNMTVGNMLEESQVGICLGNDPKAIKKELLRLVCEGKRPVHCSQSFIDQFRRDTQAKEMYQLIRMKLNS